MGSSVESRFTLVSMLSILAVVVRGSQKPRNGHTGACSHRLAQARCRPTNPLHRAAGAAGERSGH